MVQRWVLEKSFGCLHIVHELLILLNSTPTAYLLDHGQDPWLILIVPVSADAKVDFLLKRIGFVRRRELEYAIFHLSACARSSLTPYLYAPVWRSERHGLPDLCKTKTHRYHSETCDFSKRTRRETTHELWRWARTCCYWKRLGGG